MCQKVGKNVVYLERVKMGGLELGGSLERGTVRELTNNEIQLIYK